MARPSEYNFKLCEEICDKVAEGENIISILKESGYPSWSTFRRWKNENEEFTVEYILRSFTVMTCNVIYCFFFYVNFICCLLIIYNVIHMS
jgi:hypothetical protein